MSVEAHSQKKETCMHEKANTSFGNAYARESQHFNSRHSLEARKRVCTSSHEAKKRVRLSEEACMHGKANTSIRACSLGRETIYAQESHHINANAFRPGE